jgi:branched-chain amino acid transport system ATP-binding protein
MRQKNEIGSRPILELEKISRSFGGIEALSDITLEVPAGTVTGLIGPNGAGKTTLFNTITGAYPADRGRIWFQGVPIPAGGLHRVVAAGIARTFQNVALFETMTVLENVMVGCHGRSRSGFWGAVLRFPATRREERWIRETAMSLLEFVGLKGQEDRLSGDLPFGWQRLVEIARALASGPRLLLLDEPAAGLNAVETRKLGDLLEKIRNQGITLMLVEHDMSLTMAVSDRIVVLDRGRLLAQGTPREIQENQDVMAAYLGGGR